MAAAYADIINSTKIDSHQEDKKIPSRNNTPKSNNKKTEIVQEDTKEISGKYNSKPVSHFRQVYNKSTQTEEEQPEETPYDSMESGVKYPNEQSNNNTEQEIIIQHVPEIKKIEEKKETIAVNNNVKDVPVIKKQEIPPPNPAINIMNEVRAQIDKIYPSLRSMLIVMLQKVLSQSDITLISQEVVKCCKGIPLSPIKRLSMLKIDNSPPLSKDNSLSMKKESEENSLHLMKGMKKCPTKTDVLEIPEQETANLDDVETELPKRLMATMDKMTESIQNLETNEYGEWLLDITKDDELVRRIMKNGRLLSLLLENLFRKKDASKAKSKDILLNDMMTQTEAIYTAETLQKAIDESHTEQNVVDRRFLKKPYSISPQMSCKM